MSTYEDIELALEPTLDGHRVQFTFSRFMIDLMNRLMRQQHEVDLATYAKQAPKETFRIVAMMSGGMSELAGNQVEFEEVSERGVVVASAEEDGALATNNAGRSVVYRMVLDQSIFPLEVVIAEASEDPNGGQARLFAFRLEKPIDI